MLLKLACACLLFDMHCLSVYLFVALSIALKQYTLILPLSYALSQSVHAEKAFEVTIASQAGSDACKQRPAVVLFAPSASCITASLDHSRRSTSSNGAVHGFHSAASCTMLTSRLGLISSYYWFFEPAVEPLSKQGCCHL